jgi:hypothetical protein
MTGKESVVKLPMGRVLARLYAKPDKTDRVGVPKALALSLEQRPWTQVRLGDSDVWLRMEIKRALDETGSLVASFTLRRGTPMHGRKAVT